MVGAHLAAGGCKRAVRIEIGLRRAAAGEYICAQASSTATPRVGPQELACDGFGTVSALTLSFALLAAVLHATWNLLLKASADRAAVVWLGLATGAALGVPLLIAGGPIPPVGWAFAVASAVVEVGYFRALTWAYGRGDFSLVYPLVRGGAALLVAGWAVVVLGERMSVGGALGMALLLVGLAVVGVAGATGARRLGWRDVALTVAPALVVAALSATCSAIDASAVRRMSALPYTVLALGLTAVLALPLHVGRRAERPLAGVIRERWATILAIGGLMVVGYGLVLLAYRRGPVAYVASVREVSLVLGAGAGWLLRGEPLGRRRTLGAAIAFAGVVLVAVAG